MSERLDAAAFAARLDREVRAADDLIQLVCSARAKGPAPRLVVRFFGPPGARRASLTHFEGKRQVAQSTLSPAELGERAASVLVAPFESWSLERAGEDLHVRRTKRDVFLASKGTPRARRQVPEAHDREKERPVEKDDAAALLHALGLASRTGQILPGREKKYRQMNQFVRLAAEATDALDTGDRPLRILDAGCGAAYLTWGLVHHLRARRKVDVLGVDVREDVIARARAAGEAAGLEGARFERLAIRDVREPQDVVLSLHACDTATDEAIARGVALGARAILVVPCCQHELHHAIRAEALGPILRHGILRERFADLATDALRALALRAHGYAAEVIELVDPEATAKNVLIRAVRSGGGDARAREELARAKEFLGLAAPLAIERLLAGAPAAGAE